MEFLEHVKKIKQVHASQNQLSAPVPCSPTNYPKYLSLESASNGFVLNGNGGRVVVHTAEELAAAVKEYFTE